MGLFDFFNKKQIQNDTGDIITTLGDFKLKIKNNELLKKVIESQFNFLLNEPPNFNPKKKQGWYFNSEYPLKVYAENILSNMTVFEKSVDLNDDSFIKKAFVEIPFAKANFTFYINENHFFHPENLAVRDMKMTRDQLHELIKLSGWNYLVPEDFESKEKLAFKLERYYWSLINSFIRNEHFDFETNINFIFYNLLAVVSSYQLTNRINEALELNEFVLTLVEEKEFEYSLGTLYMDKNEIDKSITHFENACLLSKREDNTIPELFLSNYLMACFKKYDEIEVKRILEKSSFISINDETFEELKIKYTLDKLLNKEQKNSLIYLFKLLISESSDPDLTIKANRTEMIIKRIGWSGKFDQKQQKLLTKTENNDEFMEKIKIIEDSFKPLFELNEKIKDEIIEIIKIFFETKTPHGMIVNRYAKELLIMYIFSAASNINRMPTEELNKLLEENRFEYFKNWWALT